MASPALAVPPVGASCHGQFNGTINPALHGTGRLNSADVHFVKESGLGPVGRNIIKGEAQIHGQDCTFVQ